jgi:cytoskeletal protein RodZ
VCGLLAQRAEGVLFVSFGAELQQERVKRDVSLESIAETTKVAMRYLRALEEDTYAKLPGGVFNRGIVRSYCRCLGLDEEEWLLRFQTYARSEGEEDWTEFAQNVKRNRVSVQSRNRLRWLGVAAMLLLLAIIVAVVLQLFFGVNMHLPFLHKSVSHNVSVLLHQPPLNG